MKDAAAQGELFTVDGVLAFQMEFEGEVQNTEETGLSDRQ